LRTDHIRTPIARADLAEWCHLPRKHPERQARPGADEYGRTPLHYAARDDRPEAVRELLALDLDPSAADDDGWTPLHFAAQAQTPTVVALLLEAGAAVDIRDSYGNTPLWRATLESKGRGEVIQLLRSEGADQWCANKSLVSRVLLARTIANFPVAQFYADLTA
jgi:ankyrin repeat protein